MVFARHLAAGLIVCMAGAALAQGKAPTPEFAVEMSFQERMARFLAADCAALDFDHAGYNRHMLALLGAYSDRGHSTRRIGDLFAPPQAERFDPHFAAFLKKYDLRADSPVAAFCEAGVAEAEWRTPMGQMLKVKAE